MAGGMRQDIIQYVPFNSFADPSFWNKLTDLKIGTDKLEENTKHIFGQFSTREDMGPILEVDGASFNSTPEYCNHYVNCPGTIINKNTLEDFRKIDKTAFIRSTGQEIWNNVKSKIWIHQPSVLLTFNILSYADIKRYNYYYWFAFPTPTQPTLYTCRPSLPITQLLSKRQQQSVEEDLKTFDYEQKPFFALVCDDDWFVIKTLAEILEDPQTLANMSLIDVYFVFSDPSDVDNPGWPLRIYLAALLDHCPFLAGKYIQVIGLRTHVTNRIDYSRIFYIKIPQDIQSADNVGWVGWERNIKGNFGPQIANVSLTMDPVRLAESAAYLNIRLMKWRLTPKLNIEKLKSTKCLLLGAGTLGCHVARNLMGWGIHHITFIDSGNVSYSNPTRQGLYTFNDSLDGGLKKAQAAAQSLLNILPTASCDGIVAHIPMPSHPIGKSLMDETLIDIHTISEAIADCDVVFLLLDTREARWLPTLLGAHHGKIVINAALGFDSYLVMRHGLGLAPSELTVANADYISGGQLGCYFCNDVTAPGNSTNDRTLDQQCTVTRPGVAAIAGALAVEILIGMLQHPLGIGAPAPIKSMDQYNANEPSHLQGVLGFIPHSIRGFLYSYQTMLPTCEKFQQCIACSDMVIRKYRTEGIEFLLKVFNNGNYLEKITGLAELHLAAEMTDVMTFSDDEEIKDDKEDTDNDGKGETEAKEEKGEKEGISVKETVGVETITNDKEDEGDTAITSDEGGKGDQEVQEDKEDKGDID